MRQGHGGRGAVAVYEATAGSVLARGHNEAVLAAEQVAAAAFAAPVHIHRWRIAEAAGPTSVGSCLVCSDGKVFRNTPVDSYLDSVAWSRERQDAARNWER